MLIVCDTLHFLSDWENVQMVEMSLPWKLLVEVSFKSLFLVTFASFAQVLSFTKWKLATMNKFYVLLQSARKSVVEFYNTKLDFLLEFQMIEMFFKVMGKRVGEKSFKSHLILRRFQSFRYAAFDKKVFKMLRHHFLGFFLILGYQLFEKCFRWFCVGQKQAVLGAFIFFCDGSGSYHWFESRLQLNFQIP